MESIETIINVLIVVLGLIMGMIAVLVFQSGKSKSVRSKSVGSKSMNSDNRFAGMTFVILGDEFTALTRDAIVEIISKLGGRVESYLSDTITYALAGNDAGELLNKAKEKGIAMIDEKTFLQMIQ